MKVHHVTPRQMIHTNRYIQMLHNLDIEGETTRIGEQKQPKKHVTIKTSTKYTSPTLIE